MAWSDLLAGVSFLLLLEGLFPFVAPRAWRRGVAAIGQMNDGQLRTLGLALVVAGLVLLFAVRS